MRLCNSLALYFLLIYFYLLHSHCHIDEQQNHNDPLTITHTESTPNDDLSREPIETVNSQQINDDEPIQDTIEARLRAKHDLRQSVHQQVDESDSHENEQEYIDKLNSALEKEYNDSPELQHVSPPRVDLNQDSSVNDEHKQESQVSANKHNDAIPADSAQTVITEQSSSQILNHQQQVPDNTPNIASVDSNKASTTKTSDQKQEVLNSIENIHSVDKKQLNEKAVDSIDRKIPSEQDLQQPTETNQKPKLSNVEFNDSLSEKTESSTIATTTQIPLSSKRILRSATTKIDHAHQRNTRSSEESATISSTENITAQPTLSSTTISTAETTVASTASSAASPTTAATTQSTPPPTTVATTTATVATTTATTTQSTPPPTTVATTTATTATTTQSTPPPTTVATTTATVATTTATTTQSTPPPTTVATTTATTATTTQSTPPPTTVATTTATTATTTQSTPPPTTVATTTATTATTTQSTPPPTTVATTTATTATTTQSTPPPTTVATTTATTATTTQSTPPPTTVATTTATTATTTQSTPPPTTVATTTASITQSTPLTTTVATTTTTMAESISSSTMITDTQKLEEPSISESKELHEETPLFSTEISNNIDEGQIQNNKQSDRSTSVDDLPRQVHVHDPQAILDELKKESQNSEKSSTVGDSENHVTTSIDTDHSPHLPRIIENEQTDSNIHISTNLMNTTDYNHESNQYSMHNEFKGDETNSSLTTKTTPISNTSEKVSIMEYRQVCWYLPKSLGPRMELVENKILSFIDCLPEYIKAFLYVHLDDREKLINTIWFGSICIMCFLLSIVFLCMGAKRLKHTKEEKTFRARCQQLQQYNNQIELERATFEKQNQQLSDEIDELKKIPVSDVDEEVFELREKCDRLHNDWKTMRIEYDNLQNDILHKDGIIQKYEFDLQKHVEAISLLNDELRVQKQELDKERESVIRLQSADLSLERFEKLQETIQELRTEISELKQEKSSYNDRLEEIQQRTTQLDVENNELTNKMKHLKDLLEQRDETIARIREKMIAKNNDTDNDDEDSDEKENKTDLDNILSAAQETNANNQLQLLSNIDHDIEKASQHLRDLHAELDEKTRRIKELDALLIQSKNHCKELETKFNTVLELREHDARLHIRQLGQTDAELRKARTDTERVRILQQQLELKQKQLDDIQKLLATEQLKSVEEASKLQHEIHEKWMEVKRLTRELEGSRKECEGLRKQITRYANNERRSQEKTMHRPIPQNMNNTSLLSGEQESSGSSPPPPFSYQQGDKSIDQERHDSGAVSPADMLRARPAPFGLPRPPFFPPPFMPLHPPNPFMMAARFPMPMAGPHGMMSPIPHLITDGSAGGGGGGGSDSNSFEIVDSTNLTPNSASFDNQLNGSAVSPAFPNEQQVTAKPKKPRKSTKKKAKTSTTTTVPPPMEDV